MATTGRRKHTPDERKFIELLEGDQYTLLRNVLVRPAIAADLSAAWLHVQRQRLQLADQHLAVAEELSRRFWLRPRWANKLIGIES